MLIENLFQISFQEEEIVEMMTLQIECEANDLVATDPRHQRLSALAQYIRSNPDRCSVDIEPGNDNDAAQFVLMIDGVPVKERY